MKTIKFLSILILSIFLSTTVTSCKGDDGADGVDGVDGAQGPAGQDGNANVQTYVYNNPSWGVASGMNINMSGILTDDVIQNDAVLAYVNHMTDFGNETYLIPGLVWNGDYREYAVILEDSSSSNPESLDIVSLETDGSFTPHANLWDARWVKIIIIESTNTTTTGRNIPIKQQVLNELKSAGIDVNNYEAVCNYYGIAH